MCYSAQGANRSEPAYGGRKAVLHGGASLHSCALPTAGHCWQVRQERKGVLRHVWALPRSLLLEEELGRPLAVGRAQQSGWIGGSGQRQCLWAHRSEVEAAALEALLAAGAGRNHQRELLPRHAGTRVSASQLPTAVHTGIGSSQQPGRNKCRSSGGRCREIRRSRNPIMPAAADGSLAPGGGLLRTLSMSKVAEGMPVDRCRTSLGTLTNEFHVD